MATCRSSDMTSVFVCNMSAIEPDQRKQHIATAREVFQAVQEIQELPNGYSFRLPNESTVLLKVAEFIMREKLCCPFFGFRMEVQAAGGPLWLSLTGSEGVKPFIQAEIGEVLNETVAQAIQLR
jgi:hypothetical protein